MTEKEIDSGTFRRLHVLRIADMARHYCQVHALTLAWHYKKYAKEQPVEDRATYAQAEEQARAAQRGLWRDPEPVPPWEWR